MSGIMNMLVAAKTTIAAAIDAYFNNTTLLLNTSSTNGAQNNTFLDSSTNNFTITRNGNTTQGTFTPFSQTGWSNYFNGTKYLSAAANTAFDLGSGDFTIEAWAYFSSFTAANGNVVISKGAVSSVGADFYSLQATSAGVISFFFGSSAPVLTGSTLSENTWTHLAVTRSGTSFTLWVNGVASNTATASITLSSGGACIIGSQSYDPGAADRSIYGYVSNARIVKGTAVYASAFTPPTTPLTNITNTSLLTCQSNRFVDNSTNAFALTVGGGGSASVQAFSPFAPTAAYDTAVVGGSGYFDGAGDYLSNASSNIVNFTTGQFTIDYWFYPTAVISSSYKQHIGNAASASGIAVGTSTSGYLNATSSVSGIATGNASVIPYAWNHIVWTRDASNNIRAFLNGKLTAYAASITTSFTDTGCGIGGTPGGLYTIDGGYFSNMRVVKSLVSDYSTSSTTLGAQIFTPPTAPTTAVTNTSFLLDYTNSGIFDSTAKNVLETVGNAQVSTTQAKWGTTSMYFDGTGDWLVSYNNVAIGTANCTIEAWIYPIFTGSGLYGAFCTGPGGTTANLRVGVYTNQLYLDINGGTVIISTGTTISANTWTHIAVTRNNGTWYGFVNGVLISSTTTQGSTSVTGTERFVGVLGTTGGGNAWNGYIDDLRVTQGYARYTATFTPPTAAFPLQ